MANTYHAEIQKLYVAYFNRPADVDGLNYWETVVEGAKGDTSAVSAAFAASAEYKASFAGMGASAVVVQIYQNLFGRSPDLAGLNFWATNLAGGKITVDTVVKNIADGALGTDKTYFANKVTAAVTFTNALDTAEEIVAYSKPAASAPAKAFISGITTDASLAAAIAPAALATAVQNIVTASGTGVNSSLTSLMDTLTGTDGNDIFTARIFDNSNTLQSGDRINGGAGSGDRLEADVGNSQKFAITAETTGVELVAIRGQAVSTDSTDNNMQTLEVQIDAERMVGVRQWESNNSRADVLIEDVRILNNQITKDITIAMVETDPGHVDFGVYFDQYSLRSQTNSTNVLRLQLMDTRANAEGRGPLADSPYNGFAFFFNGVLTTVQDIAPSTAIDSAKTYAELLAAVKAAVAANPTLKNVVVELGDTFTVSDTLGTLQTGTEIKLTSTAGDTINATGIGAGWLAAGAVPPSSGLHTNMSTLASSTVDLVTSKIILDDVGRGSTGGDLVVGGLSVGDTSSSLGVQRFEIEVRDNSKLQTINSTNNTLREVTVVNGLTSSNSFAYVTTSKDKGDLTVNGKVPGNDGANQINEALPGTSAQHNAYGFSDVRLIDASAMTGKFAFTAEITVASVAKYINLIDFAANPTADNINFVYTGGANDDTMNVTIDGNVLASNSLLLTGREDFTFTANGGAGNDDITVAMVNGAQAGGAQAWYNNQVINNNVRINTGEGDDTVRMPGAGNAVVELGAGNDTIYTDNTGTQGTAAVSPTPAAPGVALTVDAPRAVWVLNTANQTNVGAGYVLATNEERNLADLRGDTQETYNLYNARLTVTYKGIQSSAVALPSTNYKATDGNVNQAIKDAVNNNAVLNKLIVVTDGPENTLVVTSKIDGVQVVTDLGIGITIPAVSSLSAIDVTAAAAAYGLPAGSNEAAVLAAMTASLATFTANGDYVAQFAETGVNGTGAVDAEIVGAASVTSSDNLATGGLGNDVIVLGTTVGVDAVASSNETVVYAAGQFNNDTIVHFEFAGLGIDQLNFSALGGRGAQFGAAINNNTSITRAVADATNDTTAEIAAFYADDATVSNHVYIAVNASNIASIYTVVDAVGTGTGNVVATLVGTIDLADTLWGNLTGANFV